MNTAIILAAGRGERLKPLTDVIPKAMCQVLNKPLIEHHIINLKKAGIERIIINHAYLGSQIRNYFGTGTQWDVEIIYSPEPPGALETGGGIVNALPLVGNASFITVNADIFTDFDFKALKPMHNSPIHLVLVERDHKLKHHGDFGLDHENYMTNNKEFTFSGIAYYEPEVFKSLKTGRYSVAPLIRDYTARKKATGQIYEGTWFDIGSIERLKAVQTYVASRILR